MADEAQAVKNPLVQAKAVRKLRASSRLALTGTPVENRLLELWSILAWPSPGYLGRWKRSAGPSPSPSRGTGTRTPPTAAPAVGPFLLRRLKTDRTIIPDLPAKQEMKVFTAQPGAGPAVRGRWSRLDRSPPPRASSGSGLVLRCSPTSSRSATILPSS